MSDMGNVYDWLSEAMRFLEDLPGGIDCEADEDEESPPDMVAHIGGLAFQKICLARAEVYTILHPQGVTDE